MTGIEWTEETWNPTTGCDKVSPGCDHCYALTMAKRLKGMGSAKYQTDGDPRTSGPGFGIAEHATALDAPLHWRKPRKIFVNSMSDLFHAGVSDEFIARVFAVMAMAPQHTFQVLTKRHGRMRSLLNREAWRDEMTLYVDELIGDGETPAHIRHVEIREGWWPLRNLWLGVSVEDQKRADLRIPALLGTPAAVRFLSCEPLLGQVDLLRAVVPMGSQRGHGLTASYVHAGSCCRRFHGIDWVIVGGESGDGARPMDIEWVRTIVEQCADGEVPIFVKQLGSVWARGATAATDSKGGNPDEWPEDLRVRQFPAAAAAVTS